MDIINPKLKSGYGNQPVAWCFMPLFWLTLVGFMVSSLTHDGGYPDWLAVPSLAAFTLINLLWCVYLASLAVAPPTGRRAGACVYLARSKAEKIVMVSLLPMIAVPMYFTLTVERWLSVLAGETAKNDGFALIVTVSLAFAIPFMVVCIVLFRRLRSIERSQIAFCMGCGQDLSGIPTHVCPECGRLYDNADFAAEAP
jgi:hypothetical protein